MGGSSVGSIGTAYVNTSNGGRLNLRTYPGSDAGVLLQIPNGSAMNVLLKGNYYWMVSYNGEIGFVDISYVTERTPSLPTASPSTPSTPTTTATRIPSPAILKSISICILQISSSTAPHPHTSPRAPYNFPFCTARCNARNGWQTGIRAAGPRDWGFRPQGVQSFRRP